MSDAASIDGPRWASPPWTGSEWSPPSRWRSAACCWSSAGGALTEYLSWRWTLYVNLIFAGVAFTGGALLLQRQPSPVKPRLDVPGAVLVSGAVFCLVYGFSNAATHHWATPSTYGFLAVGAVDGHRHGRAVRDLLVPDLLPAADAGLLATRHRRGVPADERRPHCRGQSVHDRAHAQIRPQTAGRVRDAGRLGRDGLAGSPGPAHRLCYGRARPAHPGRNRRGHGDRTGDQRRHVRRGPPGRGRRLRDRHRRPDARRLGRHLAAEHHLRERHRVLHRPASRRGPADWPPGPDRAGAGTR